MSMTDKTMGAGGVEIGANLGRNEGAIAYVSPSFSGLTVGVAGYALSASGGDQDAFDAVDLGLMYSNGPLSVNVAFENDKRAATAATAATAAFDSGDSTSIGASYAAGDLTVAATQQMTSYDTAGKADEDDTSIAVTYNMGNNKVVVGWNDNETSAGATVTDTNSNVIELQHSFSKTTAAYVQFYNTDVAAGDTTSFGLQHSF